MANQNQNKLSLISLFLSIISINQVAQQVLASGVFEINFSSLVDSYGRDLRDDCCSWQNSTSQQPQTHHHHNHHHSHHQYQLHQAYPRQNSNNVVNNNQNNNNLCDPTKCQLIIRICVKNYQTQIDPNQCTFGELSAQVVKPNEPAQFVHHPLASTYPLMNVNTNKQLFFPSNKGPVPPSPSYSKPPITTNSAGTTSATNIHHQRMLFQQQQQHSYQTPFQLQSRYQPQFYQSPTGLLSSGQPRAMRTIAFRQPITFPFNFTWPVSSCNNNNLL